jgi:hypothetical protein
MNREQAEAILDHLLAAAFELDEARAAAEILEDQDEDAASLKRLIIKLNSELLQTAYDRFPGLIPFEEFPEISSSLCWNQVQLPSSVSVAEIDRIIFSVMKPRWQKMAMVVGNASVRSEAIEVPVSHEMFAARIQALAAAGRLENQGDLRKWRHSEVRLKAEPASRLN